LRANALVGCVFSNCQPAYHNYWAIDLLDPANQPGDPIYAAGAGQAHILQTGTTCGGPGTPANAVEVNHSGGVVTWYFHLNTFTVTEGQWVDQNTQIGTMGTTGQTNPCPAYHLHFEKQVNGVRVDPGQLYACHGAALVQYPQVLGFAGWNDVPEFTHTIHSDGTGCVTGDEGTYADFDGNGTTDISVFRPGASAGWFVRGQAGAFWGTTGDIPVPGDYNGDGTTDFAVYRAGTSSGWFIKGQAGAFFGTTGDIPVPGDYNGDGTTDIAVFRPSQGAWYINGQPGAYWGTSGDIPVPGDYDNNGTTDIAIFRPGASAGWYIRGGTSFFWGTTGDIPVPGDYDGNGSTDLAVYRPGATAGWFIRGQAGAFFGTTGDIPVPGRYDANATTDIAVYRPGAAAGWFIRGQAGAFFGTTGDKPLPLPYAIRSVFFP
jgi:hypothetical protein